MPFFAFLLLPSFSLPLLLINTLLAAARRNGVLAGAARRLLAALPAPLVGLAGTAVFPAAEGATDGFGPDVLRAGADTAVGGEGAILGVVAVAAGLTRGVPAPGVNGSLRAVLAAVEARPEDFRLPTVAAALLVAGLVRQRAEAACAAVV